MKNFQQKEEKEDRKKGKTEEVKERKKKSMWGRIDEKILIKC